MNFLFGPRPVGRYWALLAAGALMVLAAFATRAEAAETIYWDNYNSASNPDSIGFASIDGSGGGTLNLGSQEVREPEGMAYDTVGNRLFVANTTGTSGQILAINLDGSGATPFTAPGAPIEEPEGVAVDPTRGMIFWENTGGGGSIAWAKLDGSAGGVLNIAGTTLNSPCCRIAVDPVGGRVYWVNDGASPATINYANVDGSGGGGELSVVGSTVEPGDEGLAVDPAAGRIYYVGGSDEIGYANLNGTGGGDVSTGGGVINGAWGIALDSSIGRLYWANESNGLGAGTNAFGYTSPDGGPSGNISIASAAVSNPQDPVILKSPIAAGVPGISGSTTTPADLSCSTGTWAGYPGSFVYAEPQSYAYQWTKDGAAIGGATSNTLRATDPGSYACTVTGTNQQGSAAQTSAGFKVSAPPAPPAPPAAPKKKPHFKLVVKTKTVRVKAGTVAKFKVKALNQGSVGAKVRICAKVPKKARKVLKSKCAKLGSVAGSAEKVATVKVKTKPQAKGTYKLKILVKGAPGKPAKAKLQIIG